MWSLELDRCFTDFTPVEECSVPAIPLLKAFNQLHGANRPTRLFSARPSQSQESSPPTGSLTRASLLSTRTRHRSAQRFSTAC